MKTFRLFLLAAIIVIAAACSGSHGADAVADKLANGETLTQSDYTLLINYCGDYATKAQVIQDKIDNLASGDPAAKSLNEELTELSDKYPHTAEFFMALKSSTPEEVGSENMKKVDELSSLIWFNAPDWAETVGPSGDAGLIEEAEPGDTGIIAAPALEDRIETK